MSRRRYRSRSSGGIAALIGLLVVVVWLIIKLIWWILGAAALLALFYLARVLMRENRKRRNAIAQYRAAIAAQADQQHQWVMQGDDRGIYGSECAPLMHYLEQGGMQPAHSRPSSGTGWSCRCRASGRWSRRFPRWLSSAGPARPGRR